MYVLLYTTYDNSVELVMASPNKELLEKYKVMVKDGYPSRNGSLEIWPVDSLEDVMREWNTEEVDELNNTVTETSDSIFG